MDLLAPDLVRRWRRRQRDAVRFAIAEARGVEIERVVIAEVSGRLVYAIRPVQLDLFRRR